MYSDPQDINGPDQQSGMTGPDSQLGGLPIGGADGKPVQAAYEVNDAIDATCPQCSAPVGEACYNPITGKSRRIPCLPRLNPSASVIEGNAQGMARASRRERRNRKRR